MRCLITHKLGKLILRKRSIRIEKYQLQRNGYSVFITQIPSHPVIAGELFNFYSKLILEPCSLFIEGTRGLAAITASPLVYKLK